MPIATNEFFFAFFFAIMSETIRIIFLIISDYLRKSQLPVWTVYAEKICVPTVSDYKCDAAFAFEMVGIVSDWYYWK